ncbi:hypothetical protein FB451DRAFT_1560152 [Mycena latifolia]|nr:hypothetical protein FB451DRAFT_1560152 [Mycena latifolia]
MPSMAVARLPSPLPMLALVRQALRLAATAGKLLLLLNAGSVYPGPILPCRCLVEWLVWRTGVILQHAFSRTKRAAALEKWDESRMPVGVHLFCAMWTYRNWAITRATPKALGRARMRTTIHTFPNSSRCGGWAPLAATHFHFIHEIPMCARYEVRPSVGAWDDKWAMVVMFRAVVARVTRGGARGRIHSPLRDFARLGAIEPLPLRDAEQISRRASGSFVCTGMRASAMVRDLQPGEMAGA